MVMRHFPLKGFPLKNGVHEDMAAEFKHGSQGLEDDPVLRTQESMNKTHDMIMAES